MSSTIKLNVEKNKLNVKLKNSLSNLTIEPDNPEDYFRKQLQKYYEQGYSEGQSDTASKLEKEYIDKIEHEKLEFYEVLKQVDIKLDEYKKSFEDIVIRVAITIAEKIVRREINEQSIISDVLKNAIKKIIGANNLVIKLNPTDIKAVDVENISNEMEGVISNIKIESDSRIEEGGCIIETDIGNIDARISTQFDEVRKNLLAALNKK